MTVKVTGNNITITSGSSNSIVRITSNEIKVKANKFIADNANTTTITPRRIRTRSTKHPSATSNNMTFKADRGISVPEVTSGVVQVVNSVILGGTYHGGSWSISDVKISITPTFNTSKIIVKFRYPYALRGGRTGGVRIYRKIGSGSFSEIQRLTGDRSTNAVRTQGSSFIHGVNSSNENWCLREHMTTFTDEPNTTDAVEYAVYAKRTYSSSSVYINRTRSTTGYNYNVDGCSFVTAFEIKLD